MTTENEGYVDSAKYEIVLDSSAVRDLDRLSSQDYKRVDKRISALEDNPRPRGNKKLKNHSSVYRVRVGPWRIIYVVDDDNKKVAISRVKRREKDTYRGTI